MPVVSTQIGCEGIGVENNHNIVIKDDIIDFKNAIIELLNDKEKAYEIARNGYEYVSENYGQRFLSERRLTIYNQLLNP